MCIAGLNHRAGYATGYEGYNISFGLQLSCYYLYLKATGNLEMKKIESNSSNLYLNIAILYNAYQIFRCSHTYCYRNCINKFKDVKEILFTNLLYSHCSCLLVSPTKTLYSNTLQIGIHSQITRKSLNNQLPWFTLCFSGLVLCNYRQYILESQLNCYFEYFASKGQQAKMQIETSILI